MCGWLVINSMRTERVQFEVWGRLRVRVRVRVRVVARVRDWATPSPPPSPRPTPTPTQVWAMHCARNAWRKKAMARLCATHAAFGGDNAGRAAMPALSAQSLDLFREEVGKGKG